MAAPPLTDPHVRKVIWQGHVLPGFETNYYGRRKKYPDVVWGMTKDKIKATRFERDALIPLFFQTL